MKNKKRNESGITLVALVVTIVVLLILAGITIMYTLGDKSIINKAKEAKNKTEGAVQNEQKDFEEVKNLLDEEHTDGKEPGEDIKSDWEKIDKIAKEIASDANITSESEEAKVTVEGKNYTIKVGDIFEVEYDGEIKQVRVLGFKHDNLVNTGAYGGNHSKAGISFEFMDCLGKHGMNGTDFINSTNENGWAATEMRTYLESAEVRNKLSNNRYIKQVRKQYIKIYDDANSNNNYSDDYLWLLAASEIWNNGEVTNGYGYAITTEGPQYQYYKGINPTYNQDNANLVKKVNGSVYYWWLRSPDGMNKRNAFCGVALNGQGNNGPSYNIDGVAPGFSI